jgi:hypothetical protein
MGQAAPCRDSFQPDELEELQKAFDTIWAALEADKASSGYASNEELRTVLSECLCALGASGVTDADRLRTIILPRLRSRPSSYLRAAA